MLAIKNFERNSVLNNKCPVCNKVFPLQKHLVQHAQEHHPNAKIFKCRDCNIGFAKIESLTHHNCASKKKVCEICSKTYYNIDEFKRHLRDAHCDERPYTCSLCINSYKYKSSLRKHQKNHLRPKTNYDLLHKPHTCELCSQAFDSTASLTNHLKEDCLKTNLTLKPEAGERSHLSLYMQPRTQDSKHSNVSRKHVCEFCSKAFHYIGGLRAHVRIHTGEKPFACKLCDKTFNQKNNLNTHIRKNHSNEEEVVDLTETIEIKDEEEDQSDGGDYQNAMEFQAFMGTSKTEYHNGEYMDEYSRDDDEELYSNNDSLVDTVQYTIYEYE